MGIMRGIKYGIVFVWGFLFSASVQAIVIPELRTAVGQWLFWPIVFSVFSLIAIAILVVSFFVVYWDAE